MYIRVFIILYYVYIFTQGPPPGGSKLVHSPAEKENESAVHSQWSPIRRNKGISVDEECIRCTKHTAKYL